MPDCELYKKYRPRLLKEIKGQPNVVKLLQGYFTNNNLPHSLMLVGPSGVGKSTTALILREKIGSTDSDFCKINGSESRGIDTVRDIKEKLRYKPITNSNKLFHIEEAQSLTKDAQEALLDIVEFAPEFAYFIFCTTDPKKITPALRSRFTEVKFSSISNKSLFEILSSIATKEKRKILDTTLDKCIEMACGSARHAINYLQMVICVEDEDQQLEILGKATVENVAYDLLKAILYQKKSWKEVTSIISNLEDQEWESLRRRILGSATTEILKANPRTMPRSYLILNSFKEIFSDKSDLVRACFDVVLSPK